MRKIVIQSITLWTIFTGSVYGQITVAIGDFLNQTDHLYLDTWEQRIPEFIQSELSGTDDILLVERKSLKAILDERALKMTGLVDTSMAQEIGRLLSVQYIITGSINQAGNWIRIDTKVINVTSGKTFGEKVQCEEKKYLDRMINLLANNLQVQLTGQGQYLEKVSIKKYPTQPFLLTTIGTVTATMVTHFMYLEKRNAYQEAAKLEDFDSYYNSANRLYKVRNSLMILSTLSLTSTLYCWIQNLSSEQILAKDNQISPYLAVNNKGEWIIGLYIPF